MVEDVEEARFRLVEHRVRHSAPPDLPGHLYASALCTLAPSAPFASLERF
jgi:hypothetical protein